MLYHNSTRKEVGSKITSNMVTRTPLDYNYIGSICTIFENGYESNWNFYKKIKKCNISSLVLIFNAILILNRIKN